MGYRFAVAVLTSLALASIGQAQIIGTGHTGGPGDHEFRYTIDNTDGLFPIDSFLIEFDVLPAEIDWNQTDVASGGDVVTPAGWTASPGATTYSLSAQYFESDTPVNPGDILPGFSFATSHRPGLAFFSILGPGGVVLSNSITGPDPGLEFVEFEDDHDGLLDVGEAPGFPSDPRNARGGYDGSGLGIEDLDGANLLTRAFELGLADNAITSIEAGDFFGLLHLRVLALGGNEIAAIDSGVLEGLPLLEYLNLADNVITTIEPGAFGGSGYLRDIYLGENELTSIPAGAFASLTNLSTLDLSQNRISSVDAGFAEGSSIRSLNLSHNSISAIDEVFAEVLSLRFLNLSHNELSSINANLMDGLALWSLDLSHNRLESIPPGLFASAERLDSLSLVGNPLTVLDFTRANFEYLWDIEGGFYVDGELITSLVLDHARLSGISYSTIMAELNSLVSASLVGLTFSDSDTVYGDIPSDLSLLLGIETLDSVRVDRSLYNLYSDDFEAFASMAGNSVTVVPEPSTTLLVAVVLMAMLCRCRPI